MKYKTLFSTELNQKYPKEDDTNSDSETEVEEYEDIYEEIDSINKSMDSDLNAMKTAVNTEKASNAEELTDTDSDYRPNTDCEVKSNKKRKSKKKALKIIRRCDWPGCDYQNDRPYRLVVHKRKHTNEKPYKCSDCSKSFLDLRYLTEHEKFVHRYNGVWLKCTYANCPYQTKYDHNLRLHLLRHENIRRFRCTEIGCDKQFFSRSTLIQHQKYLHSEERPYGCDWPGCEFRCKMKAYLNRHQMTHKTERNLKCDFNGCEKCFVTKDRLRIHRQRHQSVRRHVCSWPACGQSFVLTSELQIHMNKHENKRQQKCPFDGCAKSYFYSSHMYRHINEKHKNV